MPGKTFVFRTGSTDNAPLQDGIAALFNNHSDPTAYLEIKRIRLLPLSGASVASGAMVLKRISAISGGDAVDAVKHDTDSSSLPSQVIVKTIPDSVTATDTFRSLGEVPIFQSTVSGSQIARMQSASIGSARTQNQDFIRFPASADVERIILREGEGLAICQGAFSVPHAGAVGICIRNTSSGACYTYRSRDVRNRGAADLAHIAILNGTGSGVVLEVYSIEYPEEGEANTPTLRIARIEGIVGGVDASSDILKFDTDATIPSSIQAFEGPFRAILCGENNCGLQIDWHTRHGIDGISVAQQQNVGVFRRLSSPVISSDAGSTFYWEVARSLVWSSNESAAEDIIIRPGHGIAILAGRAGVIDNSTMNAYQVEITFNYVPPTQSRRAVVLLGA